MTFLVGGAILSALRYARQAEARHRVIADIAIATGAVLPGIGGTFTRLGHVEVLYVTDFIGLVLIACGYRLSVAPSTVEPAEHGGGLSVMGKTGTSERVA